MNGDISCFLAVDMLRPMALTASEKLAPARSSDVRGNLTGICENISRGSEAVAVVLVAYSIRHVGDTLVKLAWSGTKCYHESVVVVRLRFGHGRSGEAHNRGRDTKPRGFVQVAPFLDLGVGEEIPRVELPVVEGVTLFWLRDRPLEWSRVLQLGTPELASRQAGRASQESFLASRLAQKCGNPNYEDLPVSGCTPRIQVSGGGWDACFPPQTRALPRVHLKAHSLMSHRQRYDDLPRKRCNSVE